MQIPNKLPAVVEDILHQHEYSIPDVNRSLYNSILPWVSFVSRFRRPVLGDPVLVGGQLLAKPGQQLLEALPLGEVL